MKYKVVVIDLDGTLLNDYKKVSDKDVQTLHSLGKKNIVRIIATGRSLYSFSEVISSDFPIDYLIFAAGAGIMNFQTKEIIKSYALTSEDVKLISKKLIKLKIDFQIRDKIPHSHKYSYQRFFNENPDFDRLNSLYKNHIREFSPSDSIKEATRFITISPNNGIVNKIYEEFLPYSIIRASSPIDNKSVWMEIYPTGVNKGNSLKFLCNLLKINLSDTIGLGNDYNDVEFLNISGKSYIVANAPETLKEKYINTVGNNKNPLTEVTKNIFD